jgi:hypothetical protein
VLGADWVSFANREAEALAHLQPPLPKGALRGHMRDRLGEAFAYPLDLDVRVLVASERQDPRRLEAVPEGLTREAAALTGPLLLRTDRPLQPGSVLRLRVRMEDPRSEAPHVPPGLRADVLDFRVEVAVEP